ncbi:ABC transporter ATP-binding protein [Rhodopseudomonas palustris]|uniref:ABC transporter ATP-binding protein n=1 Tax=Rhodopseudomonas palustris TaxID=1076 RepID=A0A418V1Z0_RHOPL|nr:ABC transporter ATP-binding protein [Rhodopseudomonas palustris]RJF69941.1 ABC transporter ATP-binding protein [Rhodopseudomonas palustris]
MIQDDYFVVDQLQVSLGGRLLVQPISFGLPRGCMAAVVGPSGAGKTTLLRALAGLVPGEGQVLIGGQDVARMPVRQRARQLAYVPQGEAVHWPLPVRDVIALGRYPHGGADLRQLAASDREAVSRALNDVDLEPLQHRAVTELSGGERRRVAIARALATAAPVLLADEPMASLDPYFQLSVMALLQRQARAGALVIVVTHDIGLAARFADQVLMLRDGRLAAKGPPSAVLGPPKLAEVFTIDAYRADHEAQPVLVPWAMRSA